MTTPPVTPGPDPTPRWGRRNQLVAASVATAVLIGAGVLLWPQGRDSPPANGLTAGQNLGGGTASSAPSVIPTAPASTPPTTAAAPPVLIPPTGLTVPTASTPTAAPGSLKVSTKSLALGDATAPRTLRLTNTGGTALSYVLALSSHAIEVRPPSGILAPGSSATVTVSGVRARLPEGPSVQLVSVLWNGQRSDVTVSSNVKIPPRVATPRIGAGTCGAAGRSYRVSVAASDGSGVSSVKVVWKGSASGSTELTGSASGWSGSIGPFGGAGTVTVRAIATDSRGNTASSAPSTVKVPGPCPTP